MRSRATVSQERSVEVRPSAIHGLGVFAMRDLRCNELVTTYPVHAMRVLCDRLPVTDEHGNHPFLYFYDDDAFSNTDHAHQAWTDYGMEGMPGVRFYGDPSRRAPEACGHLINDPRGGGAPANCRLAPLFGGVANVICITSPVPRGGELLMEYGEQYWATRAA